MLSSLSFAQTKLKSSVVDQNNVPIIGATILLKNENTSLGKLTNEEGEFEVELPSGNYSLEVRYLGFQPYKKQVEINDNSSVLAPIVLQEGTEQLQNVEIVGRVRRDYNSGIQLTLKANNLFDKTYWLGGLNPSRLGPGAPRNVLLNATYRF